MTEALLMVSLTAYRVLTLTAQTYTESLLNDESAPDGRSYSIYRVLTLTAETYMEALQKDESTPNSHSYSLYRVLTLMAKPTRRGDS